MPKLIDLTDQKFGRLTVNSRSVNCGGGRVAWECLCECGNIVKKVLGQNLKNGSTKSCGCCNSGAKPGKKAKPLNLTVEVFGKLTVLGDSPTTSGYRRVIVQCSCGVIKSVPLSALKNGNTRSCGCLAVKHGYTPGGKRPVEYIAWSGCIQRCTNPKATDYIHYGGRGISISPLWRHSFQAFYNHVGPKPTPKHSLDRINNNGNYEPGNVKWSTAIEQSNNQRPKSKRKAA
jgi:hypothetical protein